MNQEEQIGASPPGSEEQIVRYLLDQMGQEERSRMDERLSCAVAFFDLAASVEEDMIMRYVRHDLEKDVSSRSAEVYMASPAKRSRAQSARVLQQALREGKRSR